MTHYAPESRTKLNQIRQLLGAAVTTGAYACPLCGNYRRPRETCDLCHGRPVEADNLLRAIRGLAKLESP